MVAQRHSPEAQLRVPTGCFLRSLAGAQALTQGPAGTWHCWHLALLPGSKTRPTRGCGTSLAHRARSSACSQPAAATTDALGRGPGGPACSCTWCCLVPCPALCRRDLPKGLKGRQERGCNQHRGESWVEMEAAVPKDSPSGHRLCLCAPRHARTLLALASFRSSQMFQHPEAFTGCLTTGIIWGTENLESL